MKLIDDGGLANAGVPGNEHQLWPAAGHDAVEGLEQGIDLGLSPVQFLWNQQPLWRVVFAKREFVDASLSRPLSKAAPKIALHAGRRLVSLLSVFGEQFHNDCRDRAGDILQSL